MVFLFFRRQYLVDYFMQQPIFWVISVLIRIQKSYFEVTFICAKYQHLMKAQQKLQSEYHEIPFGKNHEVAVNHFIDKINSVLNKHYTHVIINKAFGQYVHTKMFMYHLTTNNGDKITACCSIYCFEPKEIHGFADYVYTGHMKPMTAQKKLIEMENWPSCGAFWRSDYCDVSEAQGLINQHVSQINGKLELQEESYKIIRCWSQCVQGTNYFMHLTSKNCKKASVGMYVPLGGYEEEEIDKVAFDEEEGQLTFEITFCQKGHVNYGCDSE